MELNTFIKEVNTQSNIKINKGYFDKLTAYTLERIEELEKYIAKELSLNEYDEAVVKEKLKLPNLSNKLLNEKFEESGNELYEKLLELRRLNFKEQSLNAIKENMAEYCIKPAYSINSGNMITLSKPTLNSLSFEEIKLLTGFESYKCFDSIENLYIFLNKYEPVIQKEKGLSPYLIKGLTLYCNFEYISEDDIIRNFRDGYMKREIYRVDNSNPSTLRTSFREIRDEYVHITKNNYKLFEEIYNKYKDGIELTKQLIEEGVIEERYCSFFHPDCCLDEEDKLKALKEDKRVKEEIRTRLNGLVEKLYSVKEQINNNQRETEEYSINRGSSIYNIDEAIESLRRRGFSQEHIQGQVKRLEDWNRGISENKDKDNYVLVYADSVGEMASDFIFAGKGKVLVIRVLCSKNEYGDFVYTLGMEDSPLIIAKKGSLHKKLNIQYTDGVVEEVTSNSKVENIRNAMVTVVNRIF